MRQIIKRALVVAMVVGPILTLINQWPAFSGAEAFAVGPALLTFCVPFVVSGFSGMMALRATNARIAAIEDAHQETKAERDRLAAALAERGG